LHCSLSSIETLFELPNLYDDDPARFEEIDLSLLYEQGPGELSSLLGEIFV